MTEPQSAVVPLKGDPCDGPCYEVSKLRSISSSGVESWGRWCYKHHHWLNDAPPCKTAADELLESVK